MNRPLNGKAHSYRGARLDASPGQEAVVLTPYKITTRKTGYMRDHLPVVERIAPGARESEVPIVTVTL